MQIILVGLNHKTAAVEIRERLAFDSDSTADAIKSLKTKFADCEFVLLSTCNRVELYAVVADETAVTPADLAKHLAQCRGVSYDDFHKSLYVKRNEDSVRHLLTVTASLDSMVIGENQITTQVKDSFKLACEVKSSGKVLNRLFHTAFSTSKSIFTQTSITNGRVSVAGVAVDLARQLFENVKEAKVVVLGAGEMGELLVEHFLHVKCKYITVVNRSLERAAKIADKHGIAVASWDGLEEQIIGANIIVGAASAHEGYLYEKKQLSKIMSKRGSRTLLVVDITVPRSFDPAINDIENVYLYSIDDLAQVVEKNIRLREGDVEDAVEIICQKVAEFMDWYSTMDIGPLVGRMKNAFEQIRRDEMEKFFAGPRSDAGCKELLHGAVDRVVNKLLHCVIKNIDVVAKEKGAADAAKLAKDIVEHAEDIITDDK